jgi:AmmeMemoRadiSam system protein A
MHDLKVLLPWSRHFIAEALNMESKHPSPEPEWLHEPGACFVTLSMEGNLRGCIGSVLAHRTLLKDLQENSRAAAFEDPRFPPLQKDEFSNITIEVSLVGSMTPLEFKDEQELFNQITPGKDGVMIESGYHRGLFLPQVWEQLPEKSDFFNQLKKKAGLSSRFPLEECSVSVFQVHAVHENEYK